MGSVRTGVDPGEAFQIKWRLKRPAFAGTTLACELIVHCAGSLSCLSPAFIPSTVAPDRAEIWTMPVCVGPGPALVHGHLSRSFLYDECRDCSRSSGD